MLDDTPVPACIEVDLLYYHGWGKIATGHYVACMVAGIIYSRLCSLIEILPSAALSMAIEFSLC